MTHFVKLMSALTLGIGLSFAAPSIAASQTPTTMREFTATAAQESAPTPSYPETAIVSGLLALGLSSWWLRKRKHWLDT